MLDDYYAAYREYLGEGMRVEIGIPLSGGGVFRDWAIISTAARDELFVQISRDVLPSNVRVNEGFILDVSISIGKEVYTCSGIVVEKPGRGRILRIRLFGAFTLRERRQFFRIAMKLRIRYAVIGDGDRREIQKDWEQRKNLEQMRFQGYDEIVISAQRARYAPAIELQWRDLLLAVTNLGGGGICIRFPEPFHVDEIVALEIHLPLTPPRLVQAVAQVVHKRPPKKFHGETSYDAGMQFLYIDERDRDLVFRQISAEQISELKKRSDLRDLPLPDLSARALDRRLVLLKLLWTILILILLWYLIQYLVRYTRSLPPSEIEQTYENSIRQYRQ
jgi:c-di-GMP-binding flagellar brake protein YcgR